MASTDRGPVAAIAGTGASPVGRVPGVPVLELHAAALRSAVADAGLRPADVDCLVTANSRAQPFLYHAETVAEYVGITPNRCLSANTGGSTSLGQLAVATALVATGLSDVAVVVTGDSLASGLGRDAAIASMAGIGHPDLEAPYGPHIPALYALIARRYVHEYGVTPDELAQVAVVDRAHAKLNPEAEFRTLLTVDDVLGSPLVADPIHRLECAPISDGACAILVTSVDRARDLAQPVVTVAGVGEAHRYEHLSLAGDLLDTAALDSAAEAFRRAGVSPAEIDVAGLYDAFAFLQCLQLEDLGFCGKGEGAAYIADGNTRLGGRLPVNTHGGVLSHSHAGKPSALFLLREAVAQLRGSCGDRQVPDARVAAVTAEGGILSSHATAVLVGES